MEFITGKGVVEFRRSVRLSLLDFSESLLLLLYKCIGRLNYRHMLYLICSFTVRIKERPQMTSDCRVGRGERGRKVFKSLWHHLWMSRTLFFTVDICEHLTNWWHKNPFEGASEKWFRKRRGTRNVSNSEWPWPIFVQCDTRCPFVLMIFERNSQKDSKEKRK